MEKLSKELMFKYIQEFKIFKGLEIKVCSNHRQYRNTWSLVMEKLVKEHKEFFNDIFSNGPPTFDFIGVSGDPFEAHNIFYSDISIFNENDKSIIESQEFFEKILNSMKIKRKCLIDVKSVKCEIEPMHFSKNQKIFSRIALKLGFEVYCIKVILGLGNVKFKVYRINE